MKTSEIIAYPWDFLYFLILTPSQTKWTVSNFLDRVVTERNSNKQDGPEVYPKQVGDFEASISNGRVQTMAQKRGNDSELEHQGS